LQELPKPLSGIVWDNVVHISPRTATQLKVEEGRHLRVGDVIGPVHITPGHADACATVFLGQGRRLGTVASGVGLDAYGLSTWESPFSCAAELQVVEGQTELAAIQWVHGFEGRRPIEEYAVGQKIDREPLSEGFTLYDLTTEEELGPQWGMSIDLSRCIGCNACVAACVAENNIPVVGKDQVYVGRIMHCLSIDTYQVGDEANPRTYFQPLPCMHCETATSEP